MSGDVHHDLVHELPEYREAIHDLKVSNAHFARLFDEYHTVNREVLRIESENEAASDERWEELKKRRLMLKDQLFHMLKEESER